MSIIEQLKKNEKPFGLMSEEMQEKVRELCRSGDLQEYSCNERWEKHLKDYVLRNSTAYRLRPDYQDEPEIVECEILSANNITEPIKFRHYNGNAISIHKAVSQQGFIGFKFEDVIWYGSPIMPVDNSGNQISWANITSDDIASGKAEILTATYVLFRRQK